MLWRAGFHPGPRVTIQLQGPVPPGLRDAAEGVPPSDAVERVPPMPDGVEAVFPVSFMEGPVPPGPRDAVECIPPSAPSASEVAKRMECASLLALSKQRSTTGDLLPQPCFTQTTGVSGDPTTHRWRTRLHHGPGWWTRTVGRALKTAKLRLQSSFGAQPPSWPVAGRKPKSGPGSIGSLPRGPIRLWDDPPHSRDLCASAPRERRGLRRLLWGFLSGVHKK